MTIEQVANMFGEASRMNFCSIYRKMIQNGLFSKTDARFIVKKDTAYYLQMAMDPETWKTVTKSPAALKSKIT